MNQETLESGCFNRCLRFLKGSVSRNSDTDKHRDPKKLHEDSVISILETTVLDGKNYGTKFYRLKTILAVGLRCRSERSEAKGNEVKDLFYFLERGRENSGTELTGWSL